MREDVGRLQGSWLDLTAWPMDAWLIRRGWKERM
jgi:hypothetical protein